MSRFEVTTSRTGRATWYPLMRRKNVLIRPAAANIDGVLVVFSVKDPEPNLNLLDRFPHIHGGSGHKRQHLF